MVEIELLTVKEVAKLLRLTDWSVRELQCRCQVYA